MTASTLHADDGSLTAMLPDSSGFYKLLVHARGIDLPVRLFIPKVYDSSQDRLALVIFLSDDDARGGDLAAVDKSGIEKRLRSDPAFANNAKLLVATPQCPADQHWDSDDVSAAVTELARKMSGSFRVDADRIVIAGEGAGAAAALRIAAAQPELFAGVAVNSLSTLPATTDAKPLIAPLKHMGLYLTGSPGDAGAFAAYQHLAETFGNGGATSLTVKQFGGNRADSMQAFTNDTATYFWMNHQKRPTPEQVAQADREAAKRITDQLAKLPNAPGDYKLRFETWVGDEHMPEPYMISLPEGYDKTAANWPMLVFLHGKGETDMAMDGCYKHGPLAYGKENPAFRKWLPMIVLMPHHDNTMERAEAVVRMIHDVIPKFRIDPDRIYCTGFSYGGMSTWNLAITDPDLFAAIAPISGRVVDDLDQAARARNVPAWMICGGTDGPFIDGSNKMNAVLTRANADLNYTVIPNEGHESWTRYFSDERFYYWMLEHRKSATPTAREHLTTMPTAAGQYRMEFTTQIDGKPLTMRYGLYLPKNYATGGARWPLMISLHADSDHNTDQSLTFEWGTDVDPRRDPATHNSFAMIGVAPQLPADHNWNDPAIQQTLIALLDELSKSLNVDNDRVYGVGMTSGGNAILQLAEDHPHRFAAVAPLLSAAVTADAESAKLRDLPIRIIERSDQPQTVQWARQTADALRLTGDEVRICRVDGSDESRWRPYYTQPTLCSWLLAHRRLSDEQQRAMDDRTTRMAAANIPQTPGISRLKFDAPVDGGIVTLNYQLYLPRGYEREGDKLPMMLLMRDGAKESSTRPTTQSADAELGTDPKVLDQLPMIALCPQLPAGRTWDEPAISKALVALVDQISNRCRVDLDRVYAGGTGDGSNGAIAVVAEASDRFAGIACAVPASLAPQNPVISFCLISTPAQASAANASADTLRKAHADVQVMQLPDNSPASQSKLFMGPALFRWLAAHRRQQ